MEHCQGFNQVTVVKVGHICCKVYQKKLEKELLKLDGVLSVDINPESGLVSIKGKVNAVTLLKTVSRTGKTAEILSPNDHQSCCCRETNKCRKQEGQEEEEEHRCEDYVPPLIDERIFRDYYSRSHGLRPVFRDHHVQYGSEYPMFFGRFPGRGNPYRPRWFTEEPLWGGHGFRPGRHLSGFHNYSYLGCGDAGRCNPM